MPKNLIKQIDELKKELQKLRPFSKNDLKQLKEFYRIGLTYSSNALEGNSLTETETKVVLEDGITIGGKPLKDHYEAMGHSEAYDLLYQLAKGKTIKENDICQLHHLFYYRINESKAGQYRKEKVIITGTTYVPPAAKQVPVLMKELVKHIPIWKKSYHPVECAAMVHKEFVAIHPFVDGNGRTARLLMNLILLQTGFVVTIIPPILRSEYIQALKKGQVDPKSDLPFLNFISGCVYESMQEYIRLLRS